MLNQRAMEILDDVGVADEIYARGTPPENMRRTAFYAGFAGPIPTHGRRIARMECWGAGGTDTDWVAASPCAQTNLPQIRLEPILKRARRGARARARALPPRAHRPRAGRPTASPRPSRPGRRRRVHGARRATCSPATAAARSAACSASRWRARAASPTMCSMHMSADLSQWARDDDVLIRWIWMPRARRSSAVLVPMGPSAGAASREEWVFHLNYDQRRPARARRRRRSIADMRAALGIGDHPRRRCTWSRAGPSRASSRPRSRPGACSWSATRRTGTRRPAASGSPAPSTTRRTSAGRSPPCCAGTRRTALLDSYEPERRPVDARNVQRSLENALNHPVIGETLGLDASARSRAEPGRAAARARATIRPTRDTAARRSRCSPRSRWSSASTTSSTATRTRRRRVVPTASPAPPALDDIRLYEPSTRPGAAAAPRLARGRRRRAPRRSTSCRPGRFLLIAGEDGAAVVRGRATADRAGLGLGRSTRSASGTSTATTATRAVRGCAGARSAGRRRSSCAPTASSRGAASPRPPIRAARCRAR